MGFAVLPVTQFLKGFNGAGTTARSTVQQHRSQRGEMKSMAKKIKMLKPGSFVAMNGNTYSFSEADLRATAEAYDPMLYAAPLVKGHPEHDAPAFGRIYAVEFSDGYLYGIPGKVDAAFAEEVNSGHFDNVSLSVYSPNHPSNPSPGVYYPKHLGFLGAAPPAVKGLGQVSLAEGEEETIIIEFAEPQESKPTKKGASKMDVKKRAQFCADCEDQVCMTCCPVGAISMNADKGAIIDPAKCNVCMKCCDACCMMQGPVYGMQVANYAEQANNNKKAENASFVEGLVKQGKILPANKAAAVAVLDFCSGITSGSRIEFGEGEAKKSESPAETFKLLLGSAPKVIEFGEMVHQDDEPHKQQEAIPGDIAKYV
jgi:Fe-S-cluster-containing hydrogenase component 2